jgi:hypothetical protein
MMRYRNVPRLLPLLLAGLIAACGGGEDTAEQADMEAPPPDEGLVLDSADFAGLEAENVAFNLHWVSGPVNRDAARLAPPVNEIQDVTTLEGATFDRVIFQLGEGGIPGYQIMWTDSATVDCATKAPVNVVGEKKLHLRLTAVTAVPNAVKALDPRYENLQALAPTCVQEGGVIEYTLGTHEQTQVRGIERRAPRRLVFDVRHDPPGS